MFDKHHGWEIHTTEDTVTRILRTSKGIQVKSIFNTSARIAQGWSFYPDDLSKLKTYTYTDRDFCISCTLDKSGQLVRIKASSTNFREYKKIAVSINHLKEEAVFKDKRKQDLPAVPDSNLYHTLKQISIPLEESDLTYLRLLLL